MINSAIIFSYNNWFLAGYSPEYLFSKFGGPTLPFKMSFIYDPHPDINILIDDPVFWHNEYVMAWGPGVTISSVSYTGVASTPSISSNGCSSPSNMLIPNMALYTANV